MVAISASWLRGPVIGVSCWWLWWVLPLTVLALAVPAARPTVATVAPAAAAANTAFLTIVRVFMPASLLCPLWGLTVPLVGDQAPVSLGGEYSRAAFPARPAVTMPARSCSRATW